ncbi:MAG: hypothetical protein HY313_07365 [Acidobacteria bacterium]|nr:hypothetical protein [Acidobacteriota bacterium]
MLLIHLKNFTNGADHSEGAGMNGLFQAPWVTGGNPIPILGKDVLGRWKFSERTIRKTDMG